LDSSIGRRQPRAVWPRRDLLLRGVAGLALALSLAYLFAPGLAGIAARWQQPEYSHGYLIPVVALFIIWQRRHKVAVLMGEGSWAGVALVAGGLALLIAGKIAMSDIPQGLAFLLTLGGLGLAALGARAMRYLWAPLAFLLFALPLPEPAYIKLSTHLQLISSEWGAGLLRLLGISVFLDGNIIDLGVYKMQVAEACSGLRYLFPLASFGFLCAWLYRAPWWARATVLLSTVLITVVLNSVRIALTGVIIEHGSVALAEGFMHLFEGWVIFVVALALLAGEMWLLARLWGADRRADHLLDFDRLGGKALPQPVDRRPAPWPTPPLLACLALLLAAVPVQAQVQERSERPPERPGLVTFPLRLDDWQARIQPIDPETVAALDADDYFLADYHAPGAAAPVNLWIVYYDSQMQGNWIHSPRECLPGAGWEFVELASVPAPLGASGSPPFHLNRAVIGYGTERMLMYYWYEQRGRQITNETMTRFHILADSFTIGRSDGALVRLLTPILPGEAMAAAGRRVDDLLRLVYPHLEPHVGR
jgi:exosortase D (VPLPA-CTERM-specific)